MNQVLATITMDNTREDEIKTEISAVELQAESIAISNQETYTQAVDFGRYIKQQQAKVVDFFKPLKDAAHTAHKAICDRENAIMEPLKQAEKTIKESMVTWQTEQEQLRRAQEEIARRIQQAESDRIAKEAALREAEGKTEEADSLMDEALIAESISQSVVIPQEKTSGVIVKKDWIISITDDTAVPVSITGLCIRPVDISAIKRLVALAKGNITIPGIKITETSNIGLRR